MTKVPSLVRVLIADDHEAVRSGVAAILSQDPAIRVVAEAENGAAALEACRTYQPDVALIDMRMPDTDGIWATEHITRDTATRVLVLTTYDSDDLIESALRAGAHGYLLKDTSGEELLTAVHHVAHHRHVLDPAIAGAIISRVTDARDAQPTIGYEPRLTAREQDVLSLLSQGCTNQEIADRLYLGLTTVKTHVGSLYAKTGLSSRVALAQFGARFLRR